MQCMLWSKLANFHHTVYVCMQKVAIPRQIIPQHSQRSSSRISATRSLVSCL